MIFEALPARFGDCLLLHVPDGTKRRLMVIDGGPGGVFKESLAPRLKTLAPAGQPLTIDSVMVSHVDADHIAGIISLLRAVQDAKIKNAKPPYKVGQLIFNTFDSLAQAQPAELTGGKSVLSSLSSSSVLLGEHDAGLVLASVAQGSQLTDLARGLKVAVNPQANPKGSLLFVTGAAAPTFSFGEATFQVVGPRKDELDELRKKWAAWRAKKDKEALKALAAYLDKSVANLSSLCVLVTWKKKRLLLTGDARGDYLLEGMEMAGLLPGNDGVLAQPLDVLKLPHHGSSNNVEQKFFDRLPARHYVASGDGWHGNPDRETLEMLAAARPNGDYQLHLTYSPEHLDQEHARYLAQKGKSFDPKKHSVAPALARIQASGASVHIGQATIDLAKP